MPVWRVGDGAQPAGAFVALVPGQDAPILRVSLPDSLKGQARFEVAARQVSDRTGQSPAHILLRAVENGQEPWSSMVVAARSKVAAWRDQLGKAQGRVRALLPDYLALPASNGLWVLDVEATVMRARLGIRDGFSAEPMLALDLLRLAAQDPATRPRAVLVMGARKPALDAVLAQELPDVRIETRPEALPSELHPASFAHGELALDLARDTETRAANLGAGLRRALLPVLLGLLGAGGWLAAVTMETQQDRTVAAELRAGTRQAAQRDLLGTVPIIDLQAQVNRALRAASADQGPSETGWSGLDLLHRASAAFAETSEAQVTSLLFADGTDGLSADVIATSFQALDDLQAALRAQGIDVAVTRSGRQETGGVEANLRLTQGEPR